MDEQEFLDHVTIPASLYEKIKLDITNLFLEFHIHTYPIDPIDLALKLGCELIPSYTLNEIFQESPIEQHVDAVSHYNPDKKRFVIRYDAQMGKERLRFTIGHEIGHIRMRHKSESQLANQIANYYSSFLLAPSPWIGLAECLDSIEVSERFDISVECAIYCFRRYDRWANSNSKRNHDIQLKNLLFKKGGDII